MKLAEYEMRMWSAAMCTDERMVIPGFFARTVSLEGGRGGVGELKLGG